MQNILTHKAHRVFLKWCVDKTNRETRDYRFTITTKGDLMVNESLFFCLPKPMQHAMIILWLESVGICIYKKKEKTYEIETDESYGDEQNNYLLIKDLDSIETAIIKSNLIYNQAFDLPQQETITIRVSFFKETFNSYGCLTKIITDATSDVLLNASELVWFPKKYCEFFFQERPDGGKNHFITMPKWYHDIKFNKKK